MWQPKTSKQVELSMFKCHFAS